MNTVSDRSNDELLEMPDIAKLTRVCESSLRYYRSQGRGPLLHKNGRKLVGWRSDVLAWMATRQAETQTTLSR